MSSRLAELLLRRLAAERGLSIGETVPTRPEIRAELIDFDLDAEAVLIRILTDLLGNCRNWEEGVALLYSYALATRSELVWNITVDQCGLLLGVTGAAVSHRVKRAYNDRLERAGFRFTQAGFQKSEDACLAYAARSFGTKNALKKRPHSCAPKSA